MPSQLQMVNRCLSELGRNAVVSINDSPDAQYVSAKITELLPEVLLEYNWNFAVVYRSDSTPLTNNFSPDYTYSYQLPGDYGHFFRWASTGAQWPIYQITDGMMLAQTNPIQYYYIKNVVDYSVMPPLFARCVVLYAAAKSGLTTTNNQTLTQYLTNEYYRILAKAIMQNDMERPVFQMPYNDFNRTTYV